MVVPTEDMCWGTLRDVMGWNFGRTDLRINASKTKFHARADGHVRLAVRRPKPHKICKKQMFDPKISCKKFFGAEKSNFGNRPKRVFANFRADPSQV